MDERIGAIRQLFWNPEEKRLRAPVRIPVLFALVLLVVQLLFAVIAGIELLVTLPGPVTNAVVLVLATVAIAGLSWFIDRRRLRDLGLGYRAPYVVETAEMVASGKLDPTDALGEPYEEARETLTGFVGVGDKVADCVLLFSLGYLEAVPLDTWIQSAIADHFPECDRGSYAETSRAIRERFGGEYAGYVQTYVFHYLRTRA